MSVRTSRKAITPDQPAGRLQRGISGVTIAVVMAACAVVTLTIIQAATSGDASAAQTGIPGLIG
ncbi:hypothetical protein GKO46_06365 [SAR202 cluster bacterium JH702]|uniref:Uncharacterized protein n=1 Tax=Candidatus Lucifugimonas marina TaxID=3038979 RepID=A0ABD4XRN0_9CHLR|nr:hypothetical protein [SAR202 cluster bacterium JH702]